MLPLESKAVISRPFGAQLLKVVGLSDFPSATLPFERMALDLRDTPAGLIGSELLDLPWGGIVQSPEAPRVGERPYLTILGDQRVAKSGDVIEVDGLRQRVASRYRRGDNGNVLFATERCNSYCVMCSQPPRKVQDDWRVSQLLDLIDLIDSDEPSLAISGGEPTLLGDGLVDVVERCASVLPATHVHILSNGRLLDGSTLHSRFEGIHPNLSWGIPFTATITASTITWSKAKGPLPRHSEASMPLRRRSSASRSGLCSSGPPSSDCRRSHGLSSATCLLLSTWH